MLIDQAYILSRINKDDLIGLTTDEGEPNQVNTTRVEAAITDAHSKLYNSLAAKYKYPFEGTDQALDFLKSIEYDITIYKLYQRDYTDEELEKKDLYIKYQKANGLLEKYSKPDADDITGLTKVTVESAFIEIKEAVQDFNSDFIAGII